MRVRILAGAPFRYQVERHPLGQSASLAARAVPGLERAEVHRLRAEDDVVDVQVGLVSAGRALIDDRNRMIELRASTVAAAAFDMPLSVFETITG